MIGARPARLRLACTRRFPIEDRRLKPSGPDARPLLGFAPTANVIFVVVILAHAASSLLWVTDYVGIGEAIFKMRLPKRLRWSTTHGYNRRNWFKLP